MVRRSRGQEKEERVSISSCSKAMFSTITLSTWAL
jgi:hypothetical protein